jgi:Mg-chelatase subunit ChlD
MISIAFADGEIDADEIATLRRLYEKETGEEISVGDVAKASRFLQSSSDTPADALSAACAVMDKATKKTLLRVSYMVLLADGRVSARKRKKLHDFSMRAITIRSSFSFLLDYRIKWHQKKPHLKCGT